MSLAISYLLCFSSQASCQFLRLSSKNFFYFSRFKAASNFSRISCVCLLMPIYASAARLLLLYKCFILDSYPATNQLSFLRLFLSSSIVFDYFCLAYFTRNSKSLICFLYYSLIFQNLRKLAVTKLFSFFRTSDSLVRLAIYFLDYSYRLLILAASGTFLSLWASLRHCNYKQRIISFFCLIQALSFYNSALILLFSYKFLDRVYTTSELLFIKLETEDLLEYFVLSSSNSLMRYLRTLICFSYYALIRQDLFQDSMSSDSSNYYLFVFLRCSCEDLLLNPSNLKVRFEFSIFSRSYFSCRLCSQACSSMTWQYSFCFSALVSARFSRQEGLPPCKQLAGFRSSQISLCFPLVRLSRVASSVSACLALSNSSDRSLFNFSASQSSTKMLELFSKVVVVLTSSVAP